MTSLRLASAFGTVLLCLAAPALAVDPGQTVDNFRLTDHRDASHELYYLSDMKAVVLLAQGNGCASSRQAATQLESLRAKYEPRGVAFLLINSNLVDSREAIAAQAGANSLPILIDDSQLIGESLGLARNGEAIVLNPHGWKVAYHGATASSGHNYVADALDAMLSGAPIAVAKSDVDGCAITMPERERRSAHAQISYAQKHRAAVARQVRGLSSRWRHRTVADDELRHDPRLLADDSRSRAHAAHAAVARGSALQRVQQRSRLDERTGRTLVHWIEAGSPRGGGRSAARAAEKIGRSGRSANPTWSSSCRRSRRRRPASFRTRT